MRFSLKSRVVFPVDGPPIENGVVTIEANRIVYVGTDTPSGKIIDLGTTALMPGFVNTHTHLEFSYLRQPLGNPGMSLVEWIRLIIAERGRATRTDDLRLYAGIFESQRHGVTTIADIKTKMEPGLPDVTYFYEVIGFSRARAESAMKALLERLDGASPDFKPPLQGISPHAPYTVSPKLVSDLVSCARERNLPMAMHVAESREELQLLKDGTGSFQELLEERSMWDADAIPPKSKPLDYLRMLADAPRCLVVHGNYLNDEELQFLGSHRDRMSLIFCPRTHAYFFHPPYPLGQAIAAGVHVALGTDSCASNPDLSLLAEMRHVAETHPWVDAHTVLKMGTLNGAEAIGRRHAVGSVTPGKLANLVALPIADERLTKPHEILASILAADTPPSAVYLAGRRLNS